MGKRDVSSTPVISPLLTLHPLIREFSLHHLLGGLFTKYGSIGVSPTLKPSGGGLAVCVSNLAGGIGIGDRTTGISCILGTLSGDFVGEGCEKEPVVRGGEG